MANKKELPPSVFDHLKEDDGFDLWGRSKMSTALNKAKHATPDNDAIAAARKLIQGNKTR